MFWYKGYYIWTCSVSQKWMLQSGYEILGRYKTIGAAKAQATRLYKKGEQ